MKTKHPSEYHLFVELHSLKCKVFGHNWKFTEERWKINSDESTDDLINYRLIGIEGSCKVCGAQSWEYFPDARFRGRRIIGSVKKDNDVVEV